ncbi:maltokinase N-terminal cap-like domain-containing protein [Sanyastnella coralliicola]|uniref:maltokinase N-terminal cap-like domain-containing protein n=1 Tax=Sanyastnella coralliicola TaxID=3069118 RepID=UPI0027B90849|nr:hypothetical protein [Longitalea sp. SCSIO 12813]
MIWDKLEKSDQGLQQLINKEICDYVLQCRWYGGKSSRHKTFTADHLLPLDVEGERFYFLLLEILYDKGFIHNYLLPIGLVDKKDVEDERAVICDFPGTKKVLVDGIYIDTFRKGLFEMMSKQKRIPAGNGSHIAIERGNALRQYSKPEDFTTKVLNAEQSNTTIVYNDTFYLKLYRRLFRDKNPDIEMIQFLSENSSFRNVPAFAASIMWSRPGVYDISFGMMQLKVENQGDAWPWMLHQMKETFDAFHANGMKVGDLPDVKPFVRVEEEELPRKLNKILPEQLIQGVIKMAQRTAEMHINLSGDPINRRFRKSTYNSDYSVWLKNRLIYQFEARYGLLEDNFDKLTPYGQELAKYFQSKKTDLRNHVFAFDEDRLSSQRIRIHGDYHLGQVLVSDDDFVILDFEGEPESTIHDRCVKQSPLKDVAGMFRSFHYAIYSTIFEFDLETEKRNALFDTGERIYHWITNLFLTYYLEVVYDSRLNLGYKGEVEYLLKYHLLEKAVYELGYELNARPAWAIIPLRGIFTQMNLDD